MTQNVRQKFNIQGLIDIETNREWGVVSGRIINLTFSLSSEISEPLFKNSATDKILLYTKFWWQAISKSEFVE